MNISTLNKIRIVALLALLAGAVMGCEGFIEVRRLARLEKEGVTVDGLIDRSMSVSQQLELKKPYQGDSFDVTYTPLGEKTVTESFSVTPEFFHWQVAGDDITNPAVKVRYFGNRSPEHRIIVGGSGDRTFLLPAGAVFLFAGLAGIAISLFTRRQE